MRYEELLKSLTLAEANRATEIPDPIRRVEFLTGSLLGREVAQEALGVDRDQISIQRMCADCGGPHGRPAVRWKVSGRRDLSNSKGLDLSISHAGGWVVATCVTQGRVGVDIEDRAVVLDIESVAGRILHPNEFRLTRGLDRDYLLRTWVQKESLLKASGEGLRLPMSGICLGGGAVRTWDEHPEHVGRIDLRVLETPLGLIGAAVLIAAP